MAKAGGRTMISFMALLCLGMIVGAKTAIQTGILPRPTLWADSDSVISLGSSRTLWCHGTSGAQNYFILDYDSQLNADMIPVSGDKAKYTIREMDHNTVGRFVCQYCKASGCSTHSNEIMLMVTGFHRGSPSLSILSSPFVPLGQNVTLQCGSREQFQGFILIREGKPNVRWSQKSHQHPNGKLQAQFLVGPLDLGHDWTFRCYGHFENQLVMSFPSNVLQLLRSDESGRPSLFSPQGRIVTPGQNLTLQCHSQIAYDTFVLSKEGTAGNLHQEPIHNTQARLFQANFTLSPVSVFPGGRYYCYGGQGLKPLWSEPSDPLDILVAGQLPYTPDLSVEPGHLVSLGTNITMTCVSNNWMDTFLLTKDGVANPLIHARVYKRQEITKYLFFFHPVTLENSGTYRCYSSHSDNIFSLSYASVPLQLQVSGAAVTMSPTQHTLNSIRAVNLIRILLGAAVLLFLGILVVEALFCQGTIQG